MKSKVIVTSILHDCFINTLYAFYYNVSIVEFKEAQEIIAKGKKFEKRKPREKGHLDGSFDDHCFQHIMVAVRIRLYAKAYRQKFRT